MKLKYDVYKFYQPPQRSQLLWCLGNSKKDYFDHPHTLLLRVIQDLFLYKSKSVGLGLGVLPFIHHLVSNMSWLKTSLHR